MLFSHGVPIAEMVPNRKSSSKSGGGGMDNGAYTVTESDSSSGRGSESRSRRNSRRYITFGAQRIILSS